MITLFAGLVMLPALLWSWWRTGNDDDASLAVAIVGWMALSGLTFAAVLIAFS